MDESALPATIPPAGGPAERRPRSVGRIVVIVAASVVALVLLGAGTAVAAFMLLSGRGPQPEVAMPADTMGFVKVDLDPSAEQKVNLVRFLAANLPEDADFAVDAGSDDPVGDAIDDSGVLDGTGLRWRDIDAWAGDRAAVAVLPGDEEPVPVLIVRVDDEDELAAFFADDEVDDLAFGMVREGYAVIAEDEATVRDVVGSSQWLADSAEYQFDMEQLGGGQIVSGWADISALADTPQSLGAVPDAAADAQGHVAFGLTAEPSTLTMSAVATGLDVDGRTTPSLSAADDLGSLPADTVAAVSLASPGELVQEIIDVARDNDQGEALDELLSTSDLSERELIQLLSTTVTAFALEAPGGLDEEPLVGVRVAETDASDESAWQDVVDRAEASIAVESVEDAGGARYVYLSSTDQADVVDEVDGSSRTLADLDTFRQVVPGAAAVSVYVDLATVWDYLREQDPSAQTYDDVTAAGLTLDSQGGEPGIVRMGLRVAFSGR
jgi:hypothetical protein